MRLGKKTEERRVFIQILLACRDFPKTVNKEISGNKLFYCNHFFIIKLKFNRQPVSQNRPMGLISPNCLRQYLLLSYVSQILHKNKLVRMGIILVSEPNSENWFGSVLIS